MADHEFRPVTVTAGRWSAPSVLLAVAPGLGESTRAGLGAVSRLGRGVALQIRIYIYLLYASNLRSGPEDILTSNLTGVILICIKNLS